MRAFTFGHVRQLDRVLGQTLTRAWQAGAGRGDGRLIVDVDSFVGEVHGHAKRGAAFGYTRQRGYHPILATRADTGEVLHIRLRKGSANTSRGMLRFTDELIARVERAGAEGEKLLRADSGFWAKKTFDRLERAGWQFSIGVRLQAHVRTAIEQINETAWTTLEDYPPTSIAQIAETTLGDRRLIVRRVRTLNAQGELLPSLALARCFHRSAHPHPPASRRRLTTPAHRYRSHAPAGDAPGCPNTPPAASRQPLPAAHSDTNTLPPSGDAPRPTPPHRFQPTDDSRAGSTGGSRLRRR